MSDLGLSNLIMLGQKRKETGRLKRLSGLVTSWDPKNHSAKVMLKPENVETTWLPVHAHHVGNQWGILVGLTPGDGKATGDQVEIDFPDGDVNQPRVTARVHSDVDKPPPVESGEMLFKHATGGSIFASKDGKITWTGGKGQADQNQDTPPPTATSNPTAKGSGLDPQSQDVAGGHTIATDTQGNITVKGTKGQTAVFDPTGQMIHTGTKGQTFTFDANGNMTHKGVKGQTVVVDPTGNIELNATDGGSLGNIIATAVKDITHTAGGSLTHTAQTITDTASSISHAGNTTVTGNLGVSQILSAAQAAFGTSSFNIGITGAFAGTSGGTVTGGFGTDTLTASGTATISGLFTASAAAAISGLLTASGGAALTGGVSVDTLTASQTIKLPVYTIAGLAGIASPVKGMTVYVGDNVSNATAAFNGIPTGGGAIVVNRPVTYDGINWRY